MSRKPVGSLAAGARNANGSHSGSGLLHSVQRPVVGVIEQARFGLGDDPPFACTHRVSRHALAIGVPETLVVLRVGPQWNRRRCRA